MHPQCSRKDMKKEAKERKRNENESSEEGHVPFIEVDGIKFLSDRFYLNAPTGIPSFTNTNTKTKLEHNQEPKSNKCKTCKCHIPTPPPPPLFDRIKLIKSLDLKAVIIGTYTLCPKFLQEELPILFSKTKQKEELNEDGDRLGHADNYVMRDRDPIPTLVLHGTKGFDSRVMKSVPMATEKEQREREETENLKRRFNLSRRRRHRHQQQKENKATVIEDSKSGNGVIELHDDDDEIEFMGVVKKENTAKSRKRPRAQNQRTSISFKVPVDFTTKKEKRDVDGEKIRKEPANDVAKLENRIQDNQGNFVGNSEYSDTTHFTEVKPCFLPHGKFRPSMIESRGVKNGVEIDDAEGGIIVLDDSDNENGIDPKIASQRKNIQGVHHPKFLLLFEKSGSIVVVISTANMTNQRSVDGSWVQRFEPGHKEIPISDTRINSDGSDFGYILSDFLQKQSESAQLNQMLPIQFLRRYVCHFDTLDDLRRKYRFDRSSVHLVSTVPGVFPGRFSSNHLHRMSNHSIRILYGPQRIADILSKLTEQNTSRSSIHTKQEDTATIEPWLPLHAISNKDRLIVQTTSFGSKWSSHCVEELIRQYMGCDKPGALVNSETDLIENVDIIWPTMDFMDNIKANNKKRSNRKGDDSDFVFLTSEGFNGTDLAIVSQMKKYQISYPAHSINLSPHIKTYLRLLDKKIGKCGPQENSLAWVMLSSACFSKGAQGQAEKKMCAFEHKDEKTYSNFELGVLFVSRLQGKQRTDRLYTNYSGMLTSCRHCLSQTSTSVQATEICADSNMIALPIPFEVLPEPYQPDPDDPHFCDTPFFRSVSSKSISSGYSLLTPFGKWAAQSSSN